MADSKKKVISAYDELLETYNTRCLDSLSEEEQDEVEEMVGGNKTLAQLVSNYFLDNMPVSRYLSGPLSLTQHWSETYSKMIYVFGEYHGSEDSCKSKAMPIQDYLYKLAETTDAFIDFYLETHVVDKSDYVSWFLSDYMGKVRSKFAKCVRPKERHAKRCRLMRVHYVDVRQGGVGKVAGLFVVLWILGRMSKGFILPGDRRKIQNVLQHLADEKRLREYVEKEYEKETSKEISRVTPKKMQTQIRSFMNKEIRDSIEASGSHISIIARRLDDRMSGVSGMESTKEYAAELFGLIIPIISPVVDVYTLARIFKRFDTGKKPGRGTTGYLWWEKPVKGWEQPAEPHNIIYYAGNNHAERVRGFLEEEGFTLLSEGRDVSTRCLDMRSVPQPLEW